MDEQWNVQVRDLADDLGEIEPEGLVEGADLSEMGRISGHLDTHAEALPEGLGRTILERLSTLCEKIILEDGIDPAQGRAVLAQALSTLIAQGTREIPDAEAEGELDALEQTLGAFLGLDGDEEGADSGGEAEPSAPATLEEAAAAVETPPPDLVTVRDEEDQIVYTEFISESLEHLETIEVRVLDLENEPGNTIIIDEIFRSIHSIKGAAGFLGLKTTNVLCHEMETLLDRGRKLTLTMDQPVINVILGGVDLLKRLMANLQVMLDAALRGAEPESLPQVDVRPAVAAVRQLLERKEPPPSTSLDSDEVDTNRLGGKLVAEGLISGEDLAAALQQQKKPIGQILVDMGRADASEVERVAAAQKSSAVSTQIKVDTAKLDSLMEVAGEIVIAETMVSQDPAVRDNPDPEFGHKVNNLNKITRNMQELVMSIRMVPLRMTFQKMHRLVRDTARKTGKEAKLHISGEETEIDKTVIDEIADPLVHLLRNAVDHGIDTPEERIEREKPPEGRIDLMAYHQGGNVVIEVTDDGRGLDADRILMKALEKGLASDDRDYSENEIFNFILMPGFSTAAQATDISGRGVGMDVVKRNIEKLGGRVEIRSTLGKGSTFLIRLPLTMAVLDGMIVPVDSARYVVPTLGIQESIRPTREMISTVKGKGEMVKVRGNLIPLARMKRLFWGIEDRSDPTEKIVIVLQSDDRRVGLVVDDLLGQQQVVIKNLGERLRGIKGISGGCILGDGQVGLILDIGGVVKISTGETD